MYYYAQRPYRLSYLNADGVFVDARDFATYAEVYAERAKIARKHPDHTLIVWYRGAEQSRATGDEINNRKYTIDPGLARLPR
ncbi:MAG: hypothetical protein LIP02_07250 [Bacteroidales bacterium]|nr:hypothetical protein [Bacteroidales bacterium]